MLGLCEVGLGQRMFQKPSQSAGPQMMLLGGFNFVLAQFHNGMGQTIFRGMAMQRLASATACIWLIIAKYQPLKIGHKAPHQIRYARVFIP